MSENILEKVLTTLGIDEKKINEINKKDKLKRNIIAIIERCSEFTKLHYSLACTAPQNVDLLYISDMIDNGIVKHEGMLRCVFEYMKSQPKECIEDFLRRHDYSYEEIEKCLDSKLPLSKGELLKEMKKEMPYADFRIIVEMAERKALKEEKGEKKDNKKKIEEKYKWLEEGEISLLKSPSENTVNSEEILKKHLEKTGKKVVTRFPPEPNGRLHIGHVKAINLNFLYAEKFGGKTYLRFDDTNPRNEKEEYYKAIQEDIEWLGFKPDAVTASSDYIDMMNECTVDLIKKDKAYCCHCSLDDIRNRRQIYQRERDLGNGDSTVLSPYRNRKVEENLIVFSDMLAGKYKEGEVVVRFKMDLESRNPLMLDLVCSRIRDIIHPGKNKRFIVYPTYEFALCFSDSVENVTHSFCSREFMMRQEPYHWLLRNLGMYEPVQWEFSRLNISNTVLSKRKMNYLVENHGIDWDDPRLYTVAGMRRRGFPPEAINKFVRSVGITYSDSIVDVKILENFVRAELNETSEKIFCIKSPIELKITNLGKREIKLDDTNSITLNGTVFIDGSDFSETPDQDFQRFTPLQPVGLIGIGSVRFTGIHGSAANRVIHCELCNEKPMKYIQWVSDLSNKIALRIFTPLFKSFSPDAIDFKKDLQLDSLKIIFAYCDNRIKKANPLDRFQFIRMGFFAKDIDDYQGIPAFNLTLPLKNIPAF